MLIYKVIISFLLLVALTLLTSEDVVAQDRPSVSEGAIYSNSSRIYIPFKVADQLGQVIKTELYYRVDNGDWVRGAEAIPGINYFEFSAPRDGIYDFIVVSTDDAGNRRSLSASDTADATVVIDTADPEIDVFTPRGSGGDQVFAGGTLSVGWKVVDLSFKSVSIEFSLDGGKTYKTSISHNKEDTFSINLPLSDIETVPITLRSEDHAGHVSARTFNIHVSPRMPESQARPMHGEHVVKVSNQPGDSQQEPQQLPREVASNPLQLSIAYSAQVGPSGLSRVELWYSQLKEDESWKKNWQLYATSNRLQGRFLFQAPEPAKYAFYMVTASNAGSLDKARPVSGEETEADQIRWIDPNAPIVRIIAPSGAEAYRGNVICQIKWEADDFNFVEKPITIEYTQNGKEWIALAEQMDNTGSFDWTTPGDRSGKFKIRITAKDDAGNSTIALSNLFVIDPDKPTVLIHIDKIKAIHDKATITPTFRNRTSKPKPRKSIIKKGSSRGIGSNPYDKSLRTPNGQLIGTDPSKMSNSEKAWILFNQGSAARNAGRYDDALQMLEKANQFKPNHAGIINETALVYYGLRNYEAAVVRFAKACELAPQQPFYRLNQFSSYLKLHDLDAAALSAKNLLRTDPEFTYARQVVAHVVHGYKSADRPEMAVKFIQGLLLNPHLLPEMKKYLNDYLTTKPVTDTPTAPPAA